MSRETAPTEVGYAYLGLSTIVERTHPETGIDLTYLQQPGDTSDNTASGGGDQYTGLDRFGQVIDQNWVDTATSTSVDRSQYGYDADGNVLYQRNLSAGLPGAGGFDNAYSYDWLNRLTGWCRGSLNAPNGLSIFAATFFEHWRLDALGNPLAYIENTLPGDANVVGCVDGGASTIVIVYGGQAVDGWRWGDMGGSGYCDGWDSTVVIDYGGCTSPSGTTPLVQEDTSNGQNELTVVKSTQADPTSGYGNVTPHDLAYDANGNTIVDKNGRHLKYDAWNQLVGVYADDGNGGVGAAIATYSYDALGRRITESYSVTGSLGPSVTHLYYTASWQVIEERTGAPGTNPDASAVTNQYVWSIAYIDALVCRDGFAPGTPAGNGQPATGALTQRLYALQDANWNTTALVDATPNSSTFGQVVERYIYDPYGKVTVLSANWTPQQASGYAAGTASAYGFTNLYKGMRRDPLTGLDQADARVYSASLQRWLQVDPGGSALSGPNLYNFVGNNPVNYVDPSGLRPKRHDSWIPTEDDVYNFAISVGDGVSFGLTYQYRESIGLNDGVNPCSKWYRAGFDAGALITITVATHYASKLADRIFKPGCPARTGGNCFAAGTQVLLADDGPAVGAGDGAAGSEGVWLHLARSLRVRWGLGLLAIAGTLYVLRRRRRRGRRGWRAAAGRAHVAPLDLELWPVAPNLRADLAALTLEVLPLGTARR